MRRSRRQSTMAKNKAAKTTHHSSEAKDSLNQKLEEVCTLRKEAVKLRRQLSDKAKESRRLGLQWRTR